ncbi:LOW QUALITY PROTEIN: endothelial cell-specific chemotaxis regulator [Phodopus roborovskii]|uniref:LOW QUALITY PROTEIN: endothelial cell-specific chemotaxis regulator n=1 Tax=Phodopus roborovskii TaxID=109678 RepID=UPI0021E44CDE|nr:LOW QUALITY PROTEIN: endothelial cell-specific chemotaxis regulator [Phodopus roborovskii]
MDREYTGSLPAIRPADMGTGRAMRLGSAILGLLLFQGGYGSQPTTTQTSQGDTSPSGPDSPKLLLSTPTPGVGTGMPDSSSSSSNSSSSSSSNSSSSSSSNSSSSSSSRRRGALNSTRGEASLNATPNAVTTSLWTREDVIILPSPTTESALTVAAFGVISFIVILVVVVIVLVSVVSLRFKCQKNKESEDPQKPGSSGLSERGSSANGEKDSITLISMKNINMNNSKGCPSAEKVL